MAQHCTATRTSPSQVRADVKNKKGQSALSLALAEKHEVVVALLVDVLGPYATIEAATAAVVAKAEQEDDDD